jgi:CheY-like chemotaxis protein
VKPGLILMGIQLPDLDGLQVIRRLRVQDTWTMTLIIALAALAMPGDHDRCLAADKPGAVVPQRAPRYR